MVLRCSLLGHDYGDAEVEREREERGSEVVVTVQEYERCTRCGDKHVISENTEVRSISTGTNAGSRPDESESAPERAPAPTGGIETTFIDADSTRSEPSGVTATSAPTSGSETGVESGTPESSPDDDIELPTDENGDPVTDDGEILEDDGPSRTGDRGHGEWPDSDDVGPPVTTENEPADWLDEPSEPLDDDAVLLDAGSTTAFESESESAMGGFSVQEASVGQGAESETETEVETETEPGTGIARAGSAPTPGSEGGTPADDGPSEFYCPRCDFVASSNRRSLRTGDICPECRKGYLSERQQR